MKKKASPATEAAAVTPAGQSPTVKPAAKPPAVKPTHKAVKAYYETLKNYGTLYVEHETAVRSAFQTLLADAARSHGWTLVPEQRIKVAGKTVVPDGTLRDEYLPRGYWEAKDSPAGQTGRRNWGSDSAS